MTEPDTTASRRELDHAWSVFQSGGMAEAVRLYEAILARDPGQHEALHALGLIAVQSGRMGDGARLIGRAVALQPSHARYYTNLAYALRALSRSADALAACDRAIAVQHDFANAHHARGLVLGDLHRPLDALASFEAAIVLKPDLVDAHLQRAGALLTLGRAQDALAAAEQVLRLHPTAVDGWVRHGDALAVLQQHSGALASYDSAIRLAPRYAQAHLARGNALNALRRLADALAAFETAIALQPDFAVAHTNRANILLALGRAEDALAGYATALKFKPDSAETWNNCGGALLELGRHDEALLSYARAMALKPDYAEPKHNIGSALLQRGDFAHGFFFYEWRKHTAGAVGADTFAAPLWLGRPDIAGQTILVHYEQGFGDTLQFCRYVPLLAQRGARVIFGVQRELRRLLETLGPALTLVTDGDRLPGFDWHCPLASLPLALGATPEAIPAAPYLTALPELVARWSARLPACGRLCVGIVWRGNPQHLNDHRRSIPLADLAPLLAIDADWTCLQKDLRDDERRLLQEAGVRIVSDDLTDYAESAALVACLDLVIAADTSVAHLAGALGRPVWVLLPANPDWRWMLGRSDSPWYPSARLFRQAASGTRLEVAAAVGDALRALALSRRPRTR